MAKKKTNVSVKRKVEAYPSPRYHRLSISYVAMKDIKMSRFICDLLREKFDKMTESDHRMILKYEPINKSKT